MFAEYDKSTFPLVKVKLNKTIKDDIDFNNFLNDWLLLYSDKKPFYLLFDTRETGFINIKYAVKTSQFINKIKNLSKEWLQYSIIIVNSNTISFLLRFVFKLSPPIAPVYIVRNELDANQIYNYLINNEYMTDTNNEKLKKIKYTFISNK